MLNRTGVLAVLDHGITLNWEDGPTLHRMTAQVRYHTDASATQQLVRVFATQHVGGEETEDSEGAGLAGLTFMQEDVLRVTWNWLELSLASEAEGAAEAADYWAAQLSVINGAEEAVYLDSLDVIHIDSAYSGQFNLGAPPGLWRCARERDAPTGDIGTVDELTWEAWSESTSSAGGFSRTGELLVQPTLSNRSRPPAVVISELAAEGGSAEGGAATVDLPTEIKLEINGGRFERLVARQRTDGALLPPGEAVVSSRFLVASGDDAAELRRLAARVPRVR